MIKGRKAQICAGLKTCVVLGVAAMGLTACTSLGGLSLGGQPFSRADATGALPSQAAPEAQTQTPSGIYKVGAPYQANGKWYVPAEQPDYVEEGMASWYGDEFQGRQTANGEVFDISLPTAAHPTLPMPSMVEVTNLNTGKTITVRVNDRGPFVEGRILDLSKAAAEQLGIYTKGAVPVRVRYAGGAPLSPDAPVPAQTYVADAKPVPSVAVKPVQTAVLSRPARVPSGGLTTGAFAIQAGAFANRDNAEKLSAQLAKAGPVKISPLQANNTTLYRVLVGSWDDRAAAEARLQELAVLGAINARVVLAP